MGAVQNYVGVSRRPPDFEDYIDMMRRHRSWIVGPTYAGLVIAVVVAFFWPDTFESQAVMRITPQLVSASVVPDTLDLQMTQRIDSLRTKILSRTFLTTLISNDRLKLYPSLVQRSTVEDAIVQMQKDVLIERYYSASSSEAGAPGQSQGAFYVKFRYPDRNKARQVVERLVTEFVNQNITVESDTARQTQSLVSDLLKEAKDKLDAIQTNIVKFREANAGRLPDNAVYNANQLSLLETRSGAADDRVSSLQMDRRNLESTLQTNEDLLSYMTSSADEAAPAEQRVNDNLAALDKQIQVEESSLAALKQKYREDFPDIKAQQAKISSLKQQRDQQAAQLADQQKALRADAATKGLDVRQTANLQQQRDRIKSIETQIGNLDSEIQRTTQGKTGVEKEIQAVRAKIEASPAIDQQYSALNQDLLLAKANYDDLSRKEKASETAQDIQERHVGEQLEVLDQASLPESPIEPHRWVIAGIGIGMGLMLGLVMAGAKEAKDTSLKNLKDVRAYTNLPVLSSIPLLENALLVRRKRRLFWLAWTTAIIVGSAAMFVSITYYMTPRVQ